VTNELEELLATARRDHQAGNHGAAYRGYASAAVLARLEALPVQLAHALRHVSDLARERGSIEEAIATANEAVAIYRRQVEAHPLNLANALRLNALAVADSGADRQAIPLWEEARELYRAAGVSAGVDEAQRYLADASRAKS
jgi:hypothetical protein